MSALTPLPQLSATAQPVSLSPRVPPELLEPIVQSLFEQNLFILCSKTRATVSHKVSKTTKFLSFAQELPDSDILVCIKKLELHLDAKHDGDSIDIWEAPDNYTLSHLLTPEIIPNVEELIIYGSKYVCERAVNNPPIHLIDALESFITLAPNLRNLVLIEVPLPANIFTLRKTNFKTLTLAHITATEDLLEAAEWFYYVPDPAQTYDNLKILVITKYFPEHREPVWSLIYGLKDTVDLVIISPIILSEDVVEDPMEQVELAYLKSLTIKIDLGVASYDPIPWLAHVLNSTFNKFPDYGPNFTLRIIIDEILNLVNEFEDDQGGFRRVDELVMNTVPCTLACEVLIQTHQIVNSLKLRQRMPHCDKIRVLNIQKIE
ncbi:hypothetical protein BDQ17DRAFT_1429389 [Cyathus striatus]|nr:hypothetical protein BDQ17DRAFT_1429389 [Cyathus striatus]